MPSTLGQRIAAARRHAKMRQEDLANLVGVNRTAVSHWETDDPKRSTSPSRETLGLICEVTGAPWAWMIDDSQDVDPQWLVIPEWEKLLPDGSTLPVRGPNRIHAYEVRAVDGEDGVDPTSDVLVEEVDVLLSGGPGNYIPEFVETKYRMPFQLAWFKRQGAKPEHVKLMRVTGDSMERTLFDGDRVAVNFADTRLRDGKVYAIAIGGDAKIKRLFRLRDGGIRIVSDNNDKDIYPDEIVPGDEAESVLILGRAIDRSGSGGL